MLKAVSSASTAEIDATQGTACEGARTAALMGTKNALQEQECSSHPAHAKTGASSGIMLVQENKDAQPRTHQARTRCVRPH